MWCSNHDYQEPITCLWLCDLRLTCLENLLVSVLLCSAGLQTRVRTHEEPLGSRWGNIQCCSPSHGSSPVLGSLLESPPSPSCLGIWSVYCSFPKQIQPVQASLVQIQMMVSESCSKRHNYGSKIQIPEWSENEYVTTKGKVIYLSVNPELRGFISPGSRGCLCLMRWAQSFALTELIARASEFPGTVDPYAPAHMETKVSPWRYYHLWIPLAPCVRKHWYNRRTENEGLTN